MITKMITKENPTFYFFYFLIISILGMVMVSSPFLRYPYDAIAHLIAVDEMYQHIERTSTTIQNSRLLWHKIWANIFDILDIGSSKFLLRAQIIHVTQTYIALFSIYYFSNVLLRNLFLKIDQIVLMYLSMWSVIIWFTIYATFSIYYQLIWSLWYSINYQITLPLFFLITALTLVLFLEKTSIVEKVLYILLILLISRFILQVHSMEYMYYLMYLLVFSIVFCKKLIFLLKHYYYIFAIFIVSLIYLLEKFQFDTPYLFDYLKVHGVSSLYEKIIYIGDIVVSHYNRSQYVINELMYFIFYFGLIVSIHFLWKKEHREEFINIKVFIFVLLTSLFIFIPLYKFPAGFFGLITMEHVVHRIYYSSSLFILLPVFVYFIAIHYQLKLRYINLILIIILISVTIYSYNSSNNRHIYYKNINSIQHSFFSTKYSFPFSQDDLNIIKERLAEYKKNNHSKKRMQFFARADIAFVLKFIYGEEKVFWYSRKKAINYKKAYQDSLQYSRYYQILFSEKGLPKVEFYK